MVEFSQNLQDCIGSSSGECACEMEEFTDEILAEVAIDANRMTMFCGERGKEADAELRKHIEAHGYPTVLAEAAKHVRY